MRGRAEKATGGAALESRGGIHPSMTLDGGPPHGQPGPPEGLGDRTVSGGHLCAPDPSAAPLAKLLRLPGGPVAKTPGALNAGEPGSIPGQGIRSHMLQLSN